MDAPIGTQICALCGASAAATAQFCGQCGKPFGPNKSPSTSPKVKWYHHRWVVLLVLTPLVLGPFGLFLLWKNPNFSQREKVVWTLITLLWTGAFVWYVVAKVMPAVTSEFGQLNSLLQPGSLY